MSLSLQIENQEARAILRLLNGPLCGCEYRLIGTTTLIVAGAASTLLGGRDALEIPEYPDNTIVVPLEGGRNFELIIDDNAREGFRLRTLEPQIEEQICVYQEVYRIGTLAFSVRPIDTAWQSEPSDVTLPEPKSVPRRARQSLAVRMLFGVAVVFVLLGLGLALWVGLKENKRVAEVAAIVAGSSDQYRLAKGNDNIVYIFAQSERDVSWARQALSREGLSASVRVSTLRDEEARIGKLLLENYPTVAFYRLKLANPNQPVLLLSQERAQIGVKLRQTLTASLAAWMPYAQNISMSNWSDAMLDTQAKTGLDRLGIAYERSHSASTVTYRIQGDLSDIELTRLHTFTNNFYRDFGTRYIYFSVVLKDDWLKGKSFRYGGPGYVKMAPQHWFFPQNF